MNTYTVDKAKELIITSNPLWNKYVSLCGVVTSDECGNMYLANEQGNTMIRIEDYFKEQLREYNIKDGDTIKLEGFLNYAGKNQKSNDDKIVKANNVNLSHSSLYLMMAPKRIEKIEEEEESPSDKPLAVSQQQGLNEYKWVFGILLLMLLVLCAYLLLK